MIPGYAEQGPGYSREQVDSHGDQTPEEPLSELAQAPQTPHVEGDVNNAAMDEPSRNQPPVIAAHGGRSPVSSPADQHVRREPHGRSAVDYHGNKDREINGDQRSHGRIIAHRADCIHSLPGAAGSHSGAAVT